MPKPIKIKTVYAFAMQALPSTADDNLPVAVLPEYVSGYNRNADVITRFIDAHVAQGHTVGVFKLLETH